MRCTETKALKTKTQQEHEKSLLHLHQVHFYKQRAHCHQQKITTTTRSWTERREEAEAQRAPAMCRGAMRLFSFLFKTSLWRSNSHYHAIHPLKCIIHWFQCIHSVQPLSQSKIRTLHHLRKKPLPISGHSSFSPQVPTPTLRQPLLCSLTLRIFKFWTFHINEIL